MNGGMSMNDMSSDAGIQWKGFLRSWRDTRYSVVVIVVFIMAVATVACKCRHLALCCRQKAWRLLFLSGERQCLCARLLTWKPQKASCDHALNTGRTDGLVSTPVTTCPYRLICTRQYAFVCPVLICPFLPSSSVAFRCFRLSPFPTANYSGLT